MKLAMVTGAASGTGLTIARRFARAGWGVCVTSRSAERAQEAAQGIAAEFGVPAMGFALAAGDEAAVQAVFDAVAAAGHTVGTLVLCAADLGIGQDTMTVPLSAFSAVLETNLVWNFSLWRCAAAQMQSAGGGGIVFIGSNTSRRAIPNRAAYIASKGGMTALVKALAIDWGPLGIRVNIIQSGSIKTARWSAQTEAWRQVRRDRAPLPDGGPADDCAFPSLRLAESARHLSPELRAALPGRGMDAGRCDGLRRARRTQRPARDRRAAQGTGLLRIRDRRHTLQPPGDRGR